MQFSALVMLQLKLASEKDLKREHTQRSKGVGKFS